MKRLLDFTVIAAAVVLVGAMAQPALALCSNARLMTTGATYIHTPGWCDAGYICSPGPTSVSDKFAGTFWHVGNGNPIVGQGNDNGAFAARGNWVKVPDGYPAFMNSTWAVSQLIDGCPDNVLNPQAPEKCVAVVFSDIDGAGAPVWKLMTKGADALGNYSFQAYGVGDPARITLAALPKPQIVSSVRNGTAVDVTLGLDSALLEPGMVLDPDTQGACKFAGMGGTRPPVVGYRARRALTARNAGAPTDYASSAWTDCGTGVAMLGTNALCNASCSGNQDAYFSYSLVFDSGFELPVAGAASTRTECGSTLADPTQRIRVRETSPRTGARER